jgi:hypothetical protein
VIRPVGGFQRAAIERKIARWDIHTCGGCGYPCGYVIEGEGVLYDSGCWCGSGGPSSPRPSSWEEIAAHYNRNQPENNPQAEGKPWLAEMQAFWGFDG